MIYVSFYHSRVLGFILTRLINFKYIEDGQYFKIGKFEINKQQLNDFIQVVKCTVVLIGDTVKKTSISNTCTV